MPHQPVIGIVGSAGAYGRWLRRFFEQRMGLAVLGHDPAASDSDSLDRLLDGADVLLFSVPIRDAAGIIESCRIRSSGRESGRLWLDVTSIKQAPIAAMLLSGAEVVGLHPMTAPPKAPTLKGKVLVVCEARLAEWRPWVQDLLSALDAERVYVTPDRHDRAMALVQGMVHATHLVQASVLTAHAEALGPPSALMPLRSVSYELDAAIMARILSLNPRIYEDIQFENPHVPAVLDQLLLELTRLRRLVGENDEIARQQFREHFLTANRGAFGDVTLAEGNYTFECVGYLLADMVERRAVSVHLPEDRSGSLRALLQAFESHGISIDSIHSSRTPAGEVHFRLGFAATVAAEVLALALQEIESKSIGRVLAN